MARRGLVSKGMAQGGGPALMPKGGQDKPKSPSLLTIVEVARRLRVEPSHVEAWVGKSQLHGNASGVRPYDLNKFTLDYPDAIREAQKEALASKSSGPARKPKKGLLSKFRSLFSSEDTPAVSSDRQLSKENQRLKAELSKLKKKPASKDSNRELEEKVRFLEGKLSKSQELENKVERLERELEYRQAPPPASPDPDLIAELDTTRRALTEAQKKVAEVAHLQETLERTQLERSELLATISELKERIGPPRESDRLRAALSDQDEPDSELADHRAALAEQQAELADRQAQFASQQAQLEEREAILADREAEVHRAETSFGERESALAQKSAQLTEWERTLSERDESSGSKELPPEPTPTSEDQSRLIEQLLELQQKNLDRYRELERLYSERPPARDEKMDAELSETLRPELDKVKAENNHLKEMLKAAREASAERISELEHRLVSVSRESDQQQEIEIEVVSLRRALEAKETQAQKFSSKLEENEKQLSKALQESTRLTELLIERENRLRELSEEFDEEYRKKIENLDRQVSGLQWKLSLREERIAHLETELARTRE